MNWYVIDKDYVDYLRKFDSHVGYVQYGDRMKVHIGVLMEVNGFKYYVPVSSKKSKHESMSNNLDFHKIEDEQQFYAVINLNNMIPVPDMYVTQLKYDEITNFRSFRDERDKVNYIYLLQKEKAVLDGSESVLQRKAEKLYKKCVDKPTSSLAKRCCNFKLLEEKSLLYGTE